MKYLKIWVDFKGVIEMLSDAEKGRLFVAMLDYAGTGQEPLEFIGNEAIVWGAARRDIDNAMRESRKNSENGSKGGRKATQSNSKQDEATETDSKQLKATQSKTKQDEATESLKEKKRKEKKGNEKKDSSCEPKRFTPPTIEDVRAYCAERNNGVDAVRWFNYYTANGWKVGKNPMKDWKAAVRTWEGGQTKTVTAQQYAQRDYSGAQADTEKANALDIEARLKAKGVAV